MEGSSERAKPLQIPKHSGVHCGHSSSTSVVGNANVHTYTSMVYQLGTYNALLRNNIVEKINVVSGVSLLIRSFHAWLITVSISLGNTQPPYWPSSSPSHIHKLTLILLMAVMMSILHVGLAISKLPMYWTEKSNNN